jgi:hypothetical protein
MRKSLTLLVLCGLLVSTLRISAQTPAIDDLSLTPISVDNAGELVELTSLKEDDSRIVEAEFSPDGHTLAYIGDNILAVWDLSTESYRWRTTTQGGSVLAFSPDSSQIVAAVDGLSLWDTLTGDDPILLRVPQRGNEVPANDVAFAPDRNGKTEVIAARSQTGGIIRWQADTGEFISAYSYDFDEFNSVTYTLLSDDGSLNVIVPSDYTVEFRDTVRGEVRNRIHIDTLLGLDSDNSRPPLSIKPLAITSDNSAVILAVNFPPDLKRDTLIWLNANGEITHQIPLNHRFIWSARISPDGQIIALGSQRDGKVYIIDTETGDELDVLDIETSWVMSVDFNSSGTLFMSSGDDGTVRLWGVPEK